MILNIKADIHFHNDSSCCCKEIQQELKVIKNEVDTILNVVNGIMETVTEILNGQHQVVGIEVKTGTPTDRPITPPTA